jgi:hypothetical protein
MYVLHYYRPIDRYIISGDISAISCRYQYNNTVSVGDFVGGCACVEIQERARDNV